MRASPEILTAKWQSGRNTTGVSLAMASLLGAEAMAGSGWDSVTIDMQHGALDDRDMMQMLQAMSPFATVPFVRVPWNSPAAIMKALDAGALGLFCPLIETGEDARRFVQSCHYPPHGIRSIGPLLAQLRHEDAYVAKVAPKILSFAMIESEAAIVSIDDILAEPLLTGIYVGTADLALCMTGSPVFDPAVLKVGAAVKHIAEKARAAGKIAAIHIVNMAHAAPMREFGYQHVVFASDYRLMMRAAAEAYSELAAIIA